MSSSTQNPMDAVAALMDERARYEAWLSTLETRRGATPNHVYDRVRVDYEARLRAVLEQLAGRASELQERADALRAQVNDLQRQEDAHRDERAEAELRAAVGEHTAEQWNQIRERADAEIARLSAARQEIANDLDRVKEVLAAARTSREQGPSAPRSPSAPTVIPGPAAPAAPSRRHDAEPLVRAAERPVPEQSGDPSSFDELAFLKSVVGPRGPNGPAAPVPAEQVKTLKCQECGTMNYPTEWYCERCGGELAAM